MSVRASRCEKHSRRKAEVEEVRRDVIQDFFIRDPPPSLRTSANVFLAELRLSNISLLPKSCGQAVNTARVLLLSVGFETRVPFGFRPLNDLVPLGAEIHEGNTVATGGLHSGKVHHEDLAGTGQIREVGR